MWTFFWFSCYVLQNAEDENQADVGMEDAEDSDYQL